MSSSRKDNLKNSRNNFQDSVNESQKNDFLDNSSTNKNLKKSREKSLNQSKKSQNQLNKSFNSNNQQQPEDNQNQIQNSKLQEVQQPNQNQYSHNLESSGSNSEVKKLKSSYLKESNYNDLNNLQEHSQENDIERNEEQYMNKSHQLQTKSDTLRKLIKKYKKELQDIRKSEEQFNLAQNLKQKSQIQQKVEILQIKLRLYQKLSRKKQVISFERINHLEQIFRHYCTHIFKTGKHMTFDRLEYEKVHLTIERLSVFLKDFKLTAIKMKDGRLRQIIQKQQIIKLFKKISPNCRDLDFQQFIIIIEKLGEVYFDSKVTYQERKQNQRKQRLKIKQTLQKKQKYKQKMLKQYKEKQEKLLKGVQQTNDRLPTQQVGQNDDLVDKLIKQEEKIIDQLQDIIEPNDDADQNQEKQKKPSRQKQKKSNSNHGSTFKKSNQNKGPGKQLAEQNLTLTMEQKIQYFYQIINVDDVQSFTNKMRQLNLPLFKIYTGSHQAIKNKQHLLSQRKNQQKLDGSESTAVKQSNLNSEEQNKRLKQLRLKLNQRNQKLKHASSSNISKEQYQQRKQKKIIERMEQNENYGKVSKSSRSKQKKIDLTETEINLSSLSKLAYDNVNFSRFNPKNLYKKEDDDDVFMKEYADSPVKVRKINETQNMSKASQNTKRLIGEKDKNSQSFLQKLRQRQSQVQLTQKKEQVSQLYRFNDRTQRQKRLIDKFLQKNK